MSKALFLHEIFGRSIKYEDIPATSHMPQLLESNCFPFEKRDSKVGCEFSDIIFAIWIEVGFFGWSQLAGSIDVNYFMFFNIDEIALEITPSQRGTQIRFSFSGSFKYFSGRPTSSIRDKHDIIFTESEFSLDCRWSKVNVSTSSFLKLQSSKLLITCSVVFLHFDTNFESTWTASSMSKVGTKSKFKF